MSDDAADRTRHERSLAALARAVADAIWTREVEQKNDGQRQELARVRGADRRCGGGDHASPLAGGDFARKGGAPS